MHNGKNFGSPFSPLSQSSQTLSVCPICRINISKFSTQEKETHVNCCIVESEKGNPINTRKCIVCYKNISKFTPKERTIHIQKCAEILDRKNQKKDKITFKCPFCKKIMHFDNCRNAKKHMGLCSKLSNVHKSDAQSIIKVLLEKQKKGKKRKRKSLNETSSSKVNSRARNGTSTMRKRKRMSSGSKKRKRKSSGRRKSKYRQSSSESESESESEHNESETDTESDSDEDEEPPRKKRKFHKKFPKKRQSKKILKRKKKKRKRIREYESDESDSSTEESTSSSDDNDDTPNTNVTRIHQKFKYSPSDHTITAMSEVKTVRDFLNFHRFPQYLKTFIHHGYDTLHVVSEMNNSDLKEINVSRPGDRKKILNGCHRLKKMLLNQKRLKQRKEKMIVRKELHKLHMHKIHVPEKKKKKNFFSSKGKKVDLNMEDGLIVVDLNVKCPSSNVVKTQPMGKSEFIHMKTSESESESPNWDLSHLNDSLEQIIENDEYLGNFEDEKNVKDLGINSPKFIEKIQSDEMDVSDVLKEKENTLNDSNDNNNDDLNMVNEVDEWYERELRILYKKYQEKLKKVNNGKKEEESIKARHEDPLRKYEISTDDKYIQTEVITMDKNNQTKHIDDDIFEPSLTDDYAMSNTYVIEKIKENKNVISSQEMRKDHASVSYNENLITQLFNEPKNVNDFNLNDYSPVEHMNNTIGDPFKSKEIETKVKKKSPEMMISKIEIFESYSPEKENINGKNGIPRFENWNMHDLRREGAQYGLNFRTKEEYVSKLNSIYEALRN